jgi:hypothetical protein
MRPFLIASGIVFTVVSAAWITRLVMGIPVVVNGYSVPVAWSIVPLVVTGSLALWAFKLLREVKA